MAFLHNGRTIERIYTVGRGICTIKDIGEKNVKRKIIEHRLGLARPVLI